MPRVNVPSSCRACPSSCVRADRTHDVPTYGIGTRTRGTRYPPTSSVRTRGRWQGGRHETRGRRHRVAVLAETRPDCVSRACNVPKWTYPPTFVLKLERKRPRRRSEDCPSVSAYVPTFAPKARNGTSALCIRNYAIERHRDEAGGLRARRASKVQTFASVPACSHCGREEADATDRRKRPDWRDEDGTACRLVYVCASTRSRIVRSGCAGIPSSRRLCRLRQEEDGTKENLGRYWTRVKFLH